MSNFLYFPENYVNFSQQTAFRAERPLIGYGRFSPPVIMTYSRETSSSRFSGRSPSVYMRMTLPAPQVR